MQAHKTVIPPRTAMEVFELLPEGTLCQVIENQLYMSPAPTFPHFLMVKSIYGKINDFVEKNKLGIVAFAPVDVYLDERNVVQPDIFFITNEQEDIITKKGIRGAPDIVIEVLSEGNASFDLGEKRNVYERNGVKEYFTIDCKTKGVHAFYLESGKYKEVKLKNGEIKSKLLQQAFTF